MTQREDPNGRDSVGCSPQAREEFSFCRVPPTHSIRKREHRPHGAQQPGGPCRAHSQGHCQEPEAQREASLLQGPHLGQFQGLWGEDRRTRLTALPLLPVPPSHPQHSKAPVPKTLFLLLQHRLCTFKGQPSHLPLGIREPRTPSSGEAGGGAGAQSRGCQRLR